VVCFRHWLRGDHHAGSDRRFVCRNRIDGGCDGGILVIAISDSMSDAFGMHLAEEARPDSTTRSVWTATVATFATKFVMASTFVLPLLFLPLDQAVLACLVWGVIVLTALSIFIASQQGQAIVPVVAEHLGIATTVMVLSWLAGLGVHHWLGV